MGEVRLEGVCAGEGLGKDGEFLGGGRGCWEGGRFEGFVAG